MLIKGYTYNLISLIIRNHAYWLWKKFHPAHLFPPSKLIDSQIFPTLHSQLLHLCTIFFQKIPSSAILPTSMFIDFATFATFIPTSFAIREMRVTNYPAAKTTEVWAHPYAVCDFSRVLIMYYIVRRIARFKNAWESSPALKLKLKQFDFLMVSSLWSLLKKWSWRLSMNYIISKSKIIRNSLFITILKLNYCG